jgi:diguanylate cyclase (GGDEF)-like protein
MFIDLNDFKPINDRYGHAAGDSLLKAVGQRLLQHVRESDTVCRQGGDEFVLVFPDAPEPDAFVKMAQKLDQVLRQPFAAEHELPVAVEVSASIGLARWPDHAETAQRLLEAADAAMYRAKHMKGERIALAQPHRPD